MDDAALHSCGTRRLAHSLTASQVHVCGQCISRVRTPARGFNWLQDKTWCPPAAATSSARRAPRWPITSVMSGTVGGAVSLSSGAATG